MREGPGLFDNFRSYGSQFTQDYLRELPREE